jgi:hypothetical protein
METGVETVKVPDGLAESVGRIIVSTIREEEERSDILLQSLCACKAMNGVSAPLPNQ